MENEIYYDNDVRTAIRKEKRNRKKQETDVCSLYNIIYRV